MPISLTSRVTSTAAAVLLGVSVTTGCSASFEAQTLQPYQPAEGINGDSGSIAARNVLVLADSQGKGVLHAVLVNRGSTDDRLVSVTVDPSAQGVTIAGAQQQVLPSGEALPLGSSGKAITVTGAKPGQMVKLTISFGSAGPITADVPVLSDDHFGGNEPAAG